MIKETKERRSQKRMQVNLPVFYSYSGEHENVYDHGTTFDLNDSGTCFYTHTPLREGLNLKVFITDIWDSPRASIVRWCSKRILNLYKVGVSFQ
jgi:hypothetical protein